MKATIDIPDALYRHIKARAALGGRSVRDVTIELYRRWLAETPPPEPAPDGDAPTDVAATWLASWQALGSDISSTTADERTTREILVADRS